MTTSTTSTIRRTTVRTTSDRPWRRIAVALAVAASTLLTVSSGADAHTADDCSVSSDATHCNHRRTWAEGTVYIVARPSFLDRPANWADRLRDARDAWPTSTGRPGLSVTSIGPAGACDSAGDPTYTAKINVFYGEVAANGGGEALGLTCLYPAAFEGEGYRLRRADIVIDDDVAWSSSGAADIASDYWDLQSILTHELGHALGLVGHFDAGDSSTCGPFNLDTHTMCPGNSAAVGTVRLRTPEPHDLHTQANAY